MEKQSLKSSLIQYKEQLQQIETAIKVCQNESDKNDLVNLKNDIEQLITLTEENLETITKNEQPSTSKSSNNLDDEYMLFLQEMEKEGVIDKEKKTTCDSVDIEEDLKALEGMKCQAPHKHSWGDTVYHNAMVCGVVSSEDNQTFNEIQVRVMFTNPTHLEMLPCPYYLDNNCKFTDEKCRFSHGEQVLLSSLREYREPNFENIKTGGRVLAKRSNNLWQRAIVKKRSSTDCTVKFESNQEEMIIPLEAVLPLDESGSESSSDSSDSEEECEENDNDWLIQKSLLNTPPSQVLGEWEKHTKGIGSKLMQQMGYVVGTGLGRYSDGRLEPVQATVLPAGKSLDHCMELRENAGGDENLFSVERRLKKLQKQQEIRNKKVYEQEKQKKDVFEFLNDTLVLSKNKNSAVKCKTVHRQEIKSETNRDLNVAGFKIEEDMRRVEQEMLKIRTSLTRHNNPETAINKNLRSKLASKQSELNRLKEYAVNVKNEQSLRKDKKKLTVF